MEGGFLSQMNLITGLVFFNTLECPQVPEFSGRFLLQNNLQLLGTVFYRQEVEIKMTFVKCRYFCFCADVVLLCEELLCCLFFVKGVNKRGRQECNICFL